MLFSKKCLGIDIGVASIKVVELSAFGKKRKLENYAEFCIPEKSAIKSFKGDKVIFLSDETPDVLQAILRSSGIKEKKAAFSIPDFSTFFTSFNLPPMSKEEAPQAIEFEARHHIPIPLSEVTFDWQILQKKKTFPGLALKVLLVAVPNRILASYQKMANLSKLELKGMEAEVFGLIKSSLPKEKIKEPICLVDIGWQSTTISIIEEETLRLSHSFDISSNALSKAISSELKVSIEEAENLKRKYGLDPKRKDVAQILALELNSLALEIEKTCQNFYQSEGKKISLIILAGGTASLFGLKEYLESRTKKSIQIADPFSSVSFPVDLRSRLKELGPSFAVALGVALMGLES